MSIDKNSDYTTVYDFSGISSIDNDDMIAEIENSKAFKDIGEEVEKAKEKGKKRREVKRLIVLAVFCYIALC